MNKKKNNKGFSLIELIIAIAILIILTGLLAPQFMKYIEKSREAKDMQTMDTVYSSVQAALANEEAYDAAIVLTKDDETTPYKATLASLMGTTSANAFETEVKSLLGTADVSLKSKKATSDGVVCVAIQYKKGEGTITIPPKGDETESTTEPVETFAGFEVMIYCGNKTSAEPTGDLQPVGASLTLK